MTELTPAEKMYQRHLAYVKNYQKSHPDKVAEKCKKYRDKIKNEPERLEELKQKRKDYYLSVVKPKRDATKEAKKSPVATA